MNYIRQYLGAYRSWQKMKERVNNPNHVHHGRYVHIQIWEAWQSFEAFARDMGERPYGMTLDRIDNTGDYTPENCRWASPAEQNLNKSNNVRLTIDGVTKTVTEWARHPKAAVSRALIYQRVRRGWPDRDCVFAPKQRVKRKWRQPYNV